VPGFTFKPRKLGGPPAHGISLSPEERELYFIDRPHRRVHVFDVSRLPTSAPRLVANIRRNGRYVYVGRAGDMIDTRTCKIVDYLSSLRATATSSKSIGGTNGRSQQRTGTASATCAVRWANSCR
jgi:hypothetical protein